MTEPFFFRSRPSAALRRRGIADFNDHILRDIGVETGRRPRTSDNLFFRFPF